MTKAGFWSLYPQETPVLAGANLEARNTLNVHLIKNAKHKMQANQLASADYVKPADQQRMATLADTAQANINSLRLALANCNYTPNSCVYEEDILHDGTIVHIADTEFQISRTFYYYCKLPKTYYSTGVKETLQQIATDDCLEGERKLQVISHLDYRIWDYLTCVFSREPKD